MLADLDVFVLPSTSEGFPLVVLEAMATGRAVVATRCGGAEEVVEHEQTGLLVPVGDDQAIAESVIRLLLNPQMRARLARSGQRLCEKNFSMRMMIESYEALYAESLANVVDPARMTETVYAGGPN